jgi:hypothetical protein
MKKQPALLLILVLLVSCFRETRGFLTIVARSTFTSIPPTRRPSLHPTNTFTIALSGAVQDLDVIGLVAGQENYGLAIVSAGEALWSFLSAPSLSHMKVLIPAAVASLVLILVSGPMITSGDVGSVSTGLWIATAASTGLGVSYIARLLAPFSPSPKEIAALGLLVSIAGFFSFSQNLLVDGFVSLPSLPSLPTFEVPEINFDAPLENSKIEAPAVIPEITSAQTDVAADSISSVDVSQ